MQASGPISENAILGSADITDEEILRAVVGAEDLINSRPLTYQSTITQLTWPHLRQTISFTANEEEGLHLTVLMLWLLIQGRDGAVFKNLFDTFFKGFYGSGSQD